MNEPSKMHFSSTNSKSAFCSQSNNRNKTNQMNFMTPLNKVDKKEITIIHTNFSIRTRFKNISNVSTTSNSSDWIRKNSELHLSENRLSECEKENNQPDLVANHGATTSDSANRTNECDLTNEFNIISVYKQGKANSCKVAAEKPFSPRPKFYMMANLNDDVSANSTLAFENQDYNLMSNACNNKDVDSSDKTNFQSFEDDNSAQQILLNKRIQSPTFKETAVKNQIVNEIPKLVDTKPKEDIYLYFYSNSDKYTKIFEKRTIEMEKLIHDDKIIDAILLITVPPVSTDMEILKELYGSNALIDRKIVQCVIKFRREILESYKNCLVKISDTKYLFLKNISFSNTFPKHEFRANFQI